MNIAVLSAGRAAPASLRARLALGEEGVREVLRAPFTGELAILSTCHRTELYFTGDPAIAAGLLPDMRSDGVTLLEGAHAIRHLYRVAAGLDSLVIGEPQILGQVRRALKLAQLERAAGRALTNAFSRAIATGRAVRAETPIGTFASSIGEIAAAHVAARLGGLKGRAGVIVGSGRAAADAADAVTARGASLCIAGRSPVHVARLASRLVARSVSLDELAGELVRARFAIVAVSGGTLVTDAHVRERTEPLDIVDLSTPPAVSVSTTSRIHVVTIDDLNVPGHAALADAIVRAEAIVDAAVAQWVARLASPPGQKTREIEHVLKDGRSFSAQ